MRTVMIRATMTSPGAVTAARTPSNISRMMLVTEGPVLPSVTWVVFGRKERMTAAISQTMAAKYAIRRATRVQ